MKKILVTITLLLAIQTILHAQEKLNINVQKSTIKWIGEYTFYFGGHDGFINFKEGYLIKENEVITGGKFIIDMNSIINTDIKEKKGKDSLVDHLKNEDFFEVEKYPLAKLNITKVEYHDKVSARMEADLTLKGVTKPINFQVKFDYQKKEMKTRFKIDRQRWGIDYKSKFKDSAISDAIGFEVLIKI